GFPTRLWFTGFLTRDSSRKHSHEATPTRATRFDPPASPADVETRTAQVSEDLNGTVAFSRQSDTATHFHTKEHRAQSRRSIWRSAGSAASVPVANQARGCAAEFVPRVLRRRRLNIACVLGNG
ncbi:MAG: hypothetical protein ACKVS9_13020, partial [Phycisphaerae bacterium]